MSVELASKSAIEIRIANVGLVPKLDALGAALAAVREAHRDGMSNRCWAALHRAQDAIAEAILNSERSPEPHAAGLESGLTETHTSPAVTSLPAAGQCGAI